MHGDLESVFGGGHEFIHQDSIHQDLIHQELVQHDLHLHNVLEEATLFTLGATQAAMPAFDLGAHLSHFHDPASLPETQYGHNLHNNSHDYDHHNSEDQNYDHQSYDHQTDFSSHGWQDVSDRHDPHLHLLQHSEAHDSNGDGISDAASRDLGVNPYSTNAPHVNVTWQDSSGHLHTNRGKDSDGDGWSDALESAIGTDPHSAASHPSLVEAHHYPAGSDENLPGTYDVPDSGTYDVSPTMVPWYLP